MNVLSLFDGMSCGRIALERAGIKISKYFASEIDKYALQVSTANYPFNIQLGSVVNVNVNELDEIDLLIGGSPCQSFSFAGKQAGMSTKCKQEITNLDTYIMLKMAGFQFEGQSYLFWEYIRILNDIRKTNPDVLFLLENVKMSKKWQDVLSKTIGVEPVRINSSLVSGGLRDRLYWSNILISQPIDKKISFQSILERDEARIYKAYALTATYYKKGAEATRQRNFIKSQRPIAWINDKTTRWLTPLECERLQTVPEGYTNYVSNSQRYKMLGNGWTIDVIVGIFAGVKLKQIMGLI